MKRRHPDALPALEVPCPREYCRASIGEPCSTRAGLYTMHTHEERRLVACWLGWAGVRLRAVGVRVGLVRDESAVCGKGGR